MEGGERERGGVGESRVGKRGKEEWEGVRTEGTVGGRVEKQKDRMEGEDREKEQMRRVRKEEGLNNNGK